MLWIARTALESWGALAKPRMNCSNERRLVGVRGTMRTGSRGARERVFDGPVITRSPRATILGLEGPVPSPAKELLTCAAV